MLETPGLRFAKNAAWASHKKTAAALNPEASMRYTARLFPSWTSQDRFLEALFCTPSEAIWRLSYGGLPDWLAIAAPIGLKLAIISG